jgi:large subunit ribosomal protein L6
MSRIGKKPVEVPASVKVAIADRTVTVEGPLGTLTMDHRPEVGVEFDSGAKEIRCSIDESAMSNRQMRAYWGLTRSLLGNMVEGVTKGYQKSLEVVGVGYTAAVQGGTLRLTVGYANPVDVPIPAGVDVAVERQTITVKGADKQAVGQFAANVRAVRKPEPYQGKGIKYADEQVRRKEGKQFGA